MKIPTVAEADKLLNEAEKLNPGRWVAHSRTAALCARVVAEKCGNLNPDCAYVLGLLHDIGRQQGICDNVHYAILKEDYFAKPKRIGFGS